MCECVGMGLWERQAGVQMGRGLMGDFLLVLPVSKLTEARPSRALMVQERKLCVKS